MEMHLLHKHAQEVDIHLLRLHNRDVEEYLTLQQVYVVLLLVQ